MPRSRLALTWPARLIAPPNSSNFSVSVVLPASGCEMIANVRRRATSVASSERDGDSAVSARSDMGEGCGRETGPDQGRSARLYMDMAIARPNANPWIFAYRSNDTDQYVSAATMAA